jgi:tripartite-type tricarboxylate transporter receptor subunit TctC
MSVMRWFSGAACAVALSVAAAGGWAAANYPDKPIRLIVPYAPGGNTDILARALGVRMTESWGKPVVVDNRGSASGIVAAEIAARAAADGYTVFVGSTREMSVNPFLFRKLPYDPLKDFAAVTQGTISPILLAAHPTLPAKSMQELIALARADAKGLAYASPGIGTPMHLSGELLNMLTGLKTVHVAYNGGGPATTALLSGQEVKFGYVGMGPAIPHVKAGRLRPLAISIAKRSALLPEVPTMVELGYKEFDTSIWFAFFVPAATPKPVVAKLNAEIVRILKVKEMHDFLVNTGVEVAPSTPEELARFVREDAAKYGKVIKAAHIQPE